MGQNWPGSTLECKNKMINTYPNSDNILTAKNRRKNGMVVLNAIKNKLILRGCL